MRTMASIAILFLAVPLALAQQAPSPQTDNPPQQEPSPKPPQTERNESEAQPRPSITAKSPEAVKKEAWGILDGACSGEKLSTRVTAVRVLGLMPNDPKALKMAEDALRDEKPEVRSAAAAALGDMQAMGSIPKLREALDDEDPSVALAAAHSLDQMHDESAYGAYYEVLSGQRKSGKGLLASQMSILKDRKKMAEIGFEQGIGFIPFAGIGWEAIKTIGKDDSSPVRAAAAKVLAGDPDPATTKTLADATGDKSWLVRAAALEALAKRGDPSALESVELSMYDPKDSVKFTAAAAVLRLMALKEPDAGPRRKGKKSTKKIS